MDLSERLRASLGDRYRVDEEIGSGGMATVFRAQDLKHDRAVAIKVLREDVAQSVGAERFLQEIRIVAKLQHPHILTLLDSGEMEGTLFYVMPFIEGESLRQKLARENELPVPDALRLLREVADALAFAHQNGVVHRDIKPDNVLVTGRHAVVADFGISKALSAATGRDRVTTLGVALGTPAYMAPEQAAADATIDHRADIYAVGILGYELLTGRPPFVGSTPQQVLGAQVTETPKTVTELRPAVPEAVSSVLMRCLEKRPADRWQTAEEVRAQLEALRTTSGGITPTGVVPVTRVRRPKWQLGLVTAVAVAAVGIAGWMAIRGGGETGTPEVGGAGTGAADEASEGRIAVLQLENMTGDPSLDPMGRLASSWIERALTQASVAQVIPLQGMSGEEAEAARTASPATVALDEKAELVVTGEFYRRGEELEVVAHVLKPGSDETVFDLQGARGDAQDPMRAFETLAQQVVGAVAAYYGSDRPWTAGSRTPPPTLEAYRLADEAWELYSLERYEEVLDLGEQVNALDTVWLSYKLLQVSTYYNLDRLAEADSLISFLDERRDRLTRTEQVHLDWITGWVVGDLDLEYRAIREKVEIDPFGSAYNAANACSRSNRLGEALEHIARRDTISSIQQNWTNWYDVHFSVLARLGRLDEALEVIRRSRPVRRATRPNSTVDLNQEAQLLAALGRREDMDLLLAEAREHTATASEWSPAGLLRVATMVAAATGQIDDASHYADLALEEAARARADTRFIRARALAYVERWREAEPLMREVLSENPDSYERIGYLGWVLAKSGQTFEAEAMRDRLGALDLQFSRRRYIPYWQAAISTALEEYDRAISELQEAVASGFPFSTWTIWYPPFRPLHDDPRYQSLVAPK